jgi:hypothetical protein
MTQMPTPSLPNSQPPAFDSEYVVPSGLGWKAAGALLGGGFFLVAIVLRFVALIRSASDQPARDDGGTASGIVGGMGAACFILLAYAFSLLRRPVRARLGQREISIEGFVSRRTVPWEKVAQLRREKKTETVGHETLDVLVLADEKGKELARLTGSFLNFPALVAEVEARSAAARGAPTYDRDADLARKAAAGRKSRRKAVVLASVLTLLGLTAVTWGTYEWWTERAVREDGVETMATIDRHYMLKVTGYVDFHFTDGPNGRTVSRSAMVDRSAWLAMQGQRKVPVRYVPGHPDWNRVFGETNGGNSPLLMVGLGSALTLLFVAILVFTGMGYSDITVKDGKVRVKRFGEVDDALENTPALPAYPPPAFSRAAQRPPDPPPAVR